MNETIATLTETFSRELGSQLQAIYQLGNLVQGISQPGEVRHNLLIVTTPESDIVEIRRFFAPLWAKYGSRLGRVPLIAPKSVVRRHLALHPLLARQVQQGRLLAGENLFSTSKETILPAEMIAVLASETMRVSVCLVPELLDVATAVATQARLYNLARTILRREITEEETAVDLLGQIYHSLQHQLTQIGHNTWQPLIPPENPLLPSLESAYKFMGNLIFAFERIDLPLLTAVNWPEVADSLTGQYTSIKITTSTLLQLIATYENPLAHALRSFQHDWGATPLSDIETNLPLILRNAARKPSLIYLDDLTHTYLSQPPSADHTTIHDFQNKILNIQLEHELLHRLHQIPRFAPPEPLPDRHAPTTQRIQAIYRHLNWWAEFYADQINTA